jgi:hypothetical protein
MKISVPFSIVPSATPFSTATTRLTISRKFDGFELISSLHVPKVYATFESPILIWLYPKPSPDASPKPTITDAEASGRTARLGGSTDSVNSDKAATSAESLPAADTRSGALEFPTWIVSTGSSVPNFLETIFHP